MAVAAGAVGASRERVTCAPSSSRISVSICRRAVSDSVSSSDCFCSTGISTRDAISNASSVVLAELGVAPDGIEQFLERLHRGAGIGAGLGVAVLERLDSASGNSAPSSRAVTRKRSRPRRGCSCGRRRAPRSPRSTIAVQPTSRAPLSSQDDPERVVLVEAVLDHRLVALLEDVERDLLGWQQHERQLEDRYFDRCPGTRG